MRKLKSEPIPGGIWAPTTNPAPELVGVGEEDLERLGEGASAEHFPAPRPPFAAPEEIAGAVEAGMNGLSPDERIASVEHISASAARIASTSDIYLDFPFGSDRSVEQQLDVSSTALQSLWLDVTVMPTSAAGKLTVSIQGPGLSFTHELAPLGVLDVNNKRRHLVHVARSSIRGGGGDWFGKGVDKLTVTGSGVRLYCIGLKERAPAQGPNGNFYELIVNEEGADWRQAWMHANRMTFQGKPGHLATVTTVEELQFLVDNFGLDVDAWLGGSGNPASGDWEWITAEQFPTGLWAHDLQAEGAARRFVVLEAAERGGRLSFDRPRMTRNRRPMGFFVEYAPAALTPAGSDVEVSLPAGITVTFTTVSSDGMTSSVSSDVAGSFLPPEYTLVGDIVDITTSAIVVGSVEVCFPHEGDPAGLSIIHLVGDTWMEQATTVDPSANRVCALSDGLSLFALVRTRAPAAPFFVDVPAPLVVEQESLEGTVVEVAVPVAFDGDGEALNVLSSAPGPTLFAPGTTLVHFVAVDELGRQVAASASVTVVDTTPPIFVEVPGPFLIECGGPEGTTINIGLPIVADVADPTPRVYSDALSTYPLGTTLVTFTAVDRSGNVSTASTMVVVNDSIAPVITAAVEPNRIWPPDHRMVPVRVAARASDTCDAFPTCFIADVTSSEPIDGQGDGQTAPDWEIATDTLVSLRAERSGVGDGRVYSIVVACSDASGNVELTSTEVRVEHDLGRDE